MRRVNDKSCYNYGSSTQDNPSNNSTTSFEFHKGSSAHHHRKVLGSRAKPTPSKWDDAQKWLVGLSGVGGGGERSRSKPRNSNADDRRLLSCASQKGRDSCSSADGALEDYAALAITVHDEGETKKIDCGEPVWRTSKPAEDSALVVRSVCVRDMGTEMTPIASQEPSRTATPIRATTPVLRSPISSRSSTPGRRRPGVEAVESVKSLERKSEALLFGMANGNGRLIRAEGELDGCKVLGNGGCGLEPVRISNSLESRAIAWDEAERAKYMARYKREEVKIQAWENHEKRKAETEMKRMEVKAERLKSRAQERLVSKLASTRRIAEEKRANAEAKLNERAARTSERADYIRRTGRLPSSFSFKMPSFCG